MGYPVHISWNGSLVVSAPSAVPNVPRTEAAFPRCTAIDMRWRRNSVERRSPDASSSLLPTSDMRLQPSGPHAPAVSTAIGTKVTPAPRPMYLALLATSASVAADPAASEEAWRWEGANVSGHVTSQAIQRPLAHGIRVTPSGLFPSCLRRPVGSLDAGIEAARSDLANRSFMASCLWCRPALRRQAKPCRPLGKTWAPQVQVCPCTMSAPTWSPIAILRAWSLSLRPRVAKGRAFNQSPEPLLPAAKHRLRATGSLFEAMSAWLVALQITLSQWRWLRVSTGRGSDAPPRDNHA